MKKPERNCKQTEGWRGEEGETLKGLQRGNVPGPVNPDRKHHVSLSKTRGVTLKFSSSLWSCVSDDVFYVSILLTCQVMRFAS